MKGILVACGLTLGLSCAAWAAGPDNSEDICTQSYVVFCENFETRIVGPIYLHQFEPIYKSDGWGAYQFDCMQITNDPNGVYDGTRAYVEIYNAGPTTGCANMYMQIPGWLSQSWTDLYFRYYVKESSNFQISEIANKFMVWNDGAGNEGGHMGGMRISTVSTGPTTVATIGLGTNGWSKQGTDGCNTAALQTFADLPGQHCELLPNENGSTAPWIPGHWYCEEVHIRMNSSEFVADGIFEKWINEATVPVVNQTRRFNYPNSYIAYPYNVYVNPYTPAPWIISMSGFVKMSFWNCAAGDLPGADGLCHPDDDSTQTLPPRNPASIHPLMYRYTDNIVIGTQRIGCLGNPVAPPTLPSPPTNLKAS